jgi:hypothetical protein
MLRQLGARDRKDVPSCLISESNVAYIRGPGSLVHPNSVRDPELVQSNSIRLSKLIYSNCTGNRPGSLVHPHGH